MEAGAHIIGATQDSQQNGSQPNAAALDTGRSHSFGARTKDMEAVLGASLTRRAEVLRMPTIEQRLVQRREGIGYLSEFQSRSVRRIQSRPGDHHCRRWKSSQRA